jgi:N-acylglucosamine 2-epimerase
MALSEYSRVSNESKYWDAAMEVFNSILGWARDPSPLGRSLPSAAPTSPLNVPMIILNVIEEIRNTSDVTKYDRSLFEKDAEWCVEEIKKHYHPEKKLVFELVSSKGELLLDVPEGRLIMPGHAIECGWFLLAFARRNPQFKDSEQLVQMAINMVDWSFEFGWDQEDGGILLIRDSEGYDAVQMEKDNKLWWPHNEAMIAYLMMYQVTKDKKHWERFEQVYKYSFDHFSDHGTLHVSIC